MARSRADPRRVVGFALKFAHSTIAGAQAAQPSDTTRTSTTGGPTELGSGLGGAGTLPG
ncbi:hypothetical protein VH571_13105 [Frondihabitans sp. 4ASC-45]